MHTMVNKQKLTVYANRLKFIHIFTNITCILFIKRVLYKYSKTKGAKVIGINLKKLRKLRFDNDKTQKDLADILDMTQQNYSKKEAGEVKFTIEEAILMAKYFNIAIEDIFFD